jgi:formate dehydrogenase major subunit
MAMNTPHSPVNKLTGPRTDRATHTPAYKELAVSLKVIGKADPPLPPTNFRFGHPTPQRGVEVERKWRRPDYVEPGAELVQLKMTKR